jgi:DNA polymerase-3 subunit delta
LIYLLVDDLAGRARLAELVARLGDASAASLNTSTFDGARFEIGDLQAACEALPFLADRRLIVVRGALARSAPAGGVPGASEGRSGSRGRGGSGAEAGLVEYLERVPDHADLVLLEGDMPASSGAALKAIEALAKGGRAEIVRDLPLDEAGAAQFAREQARALGGGMDGDAAMALVDAVGTDRRVLVRELEKLTLLADARAVSVDDVRALTRAIDQGRIFELVDAIGARNARVAVRSWRTLLRAGEDPHRLLAMVARQFRLLIQAAELGARRVPPPVAASALGVPPRVAGAMMNQARAWPSGGLEAIYRRIVVMDEESKIGGPELEPALEALILELVAARR